MSLRNYSVCIIFQEPRDNVQSFTSTEAQTELALQSVPEVHEDLDGVRGARRRERRLRRQHRRALRSCSLPPSYPGALAGCQASTAPGVPLVTPPRGFLHPPPPHLGLRGLSLGLPFPVSTSVSAFGRWLCARFNYLCTNKPSKWNPTNCPTIWTLRPFLNSILSDFKAKSTII